MYKKIKATITSLKKNTSYQGETIEKKVNRIVNNKEPIKDGAPLIYTARKDGVRAEMDIRTDRFELAIDAMDLVNKDKLAKREQRQTDRDKIGEQAKEGMIKENGGTEPTQATSN